MRPCAHGALTSHPRVAAGPAPSYSHPRPCTHRDAELCVPWPQGEIRRGRWRVLDRECLEAGEHLCGQRATRQGAEETAVSRGRLDPRRVVGGSISELAGSTSGRTVALAQPGSTCQSRRPPSPCLGGCGSSDRPGSFAAAPQEPPPSGEQAASAPRHHQVQEGQRGCPGPQPQSKSAKSKGGGASTAAGRAAKAAMGPGAH